MDELSSLNNGLHVFLRSGRAFFECGAGSQLMHALTLDDMGPHHEAQANSIKLQKCYSWAS